MTSRFVDRAREIIKGWGTTDFLVSRNAHLFGPRGDTTNPLVAWKRLRDLRRSYSSRLGELAERTVNSKWTKLGPTRSMQLGDLLQLSTLWQIDPSKDKNSQVTTKLGEAWVSNVAELNAMWKKLDSEQQDLYHSIQKYFKQEYAQIRRASIDLAIGLYGGQITDQQRLLLYALRNADGVTGLVGAGKLIDLGDQNDKFTMVLHDLIRVSSISGPYFPLMRKGNLVVEADREGILNDDAGRPRNFDTKAEAQAQAKSIRMAAPKNTARVIEEGGKFQVKYKIRHVSFHTSQREAAAAQDELRAKGFTTGSYTQKLESVESASLTEGLKELMTKAESIAGVGAQPSAEQKLVVQTLQSAFVQLLAERAASASQQLKRQGVAGFKGSEAHEIFARRVRASSWHYANLKTALDQTKILTRLRTAAREPGQPQKLAMERGRVLHEIMARLRVEAEELDSLDHSKAEFIMGQLGFVNFLATPSYAFVNAMQNFNVTLPYLTGLYGFKGGKALMRGMKAVVGPGFTKALRGAVSRPGGVTVYDVYTAMIEALADHPRFAKFTKPDGNKPSALQQLVDMNVINASFVQELAAVANNQSLLVTQGLEWLRLFPQGAELLNRISTSLAVLDLTNGNVDAAAEAVRKTHFDYSIENRPRFFRKIGGYRMPAWITMFKMYGISMYQLIGSLVVDAAGNRGQTRADRGRAATALAGIIASHVLSAGVLHSVMLEPLRLLMAVWQAAFGDDDEFYDLDTQVQNWAADITGSEAGGRILSKGLWNALGFDLSGRMGLDRLLMYDPPESFTDTEMEKLVVGLLGPIPGAMVERATRAWKTATIYGRPYEAILEAIPVRPLQDAWKAWKLLNEGITTPAGDTLVSPDDLDMFDVTGRAAGFQLSEAARATAQAATTFKYNNWRSARVQQLAHAFWEAHDSGDASAKAEAIADIQTFNRKNPGAPVTGQSLKQSRQARQRGVRERSGEGRNPDLNKLLDY
jgi:hypothetical protein